jgi:hypothetical protein
MALRFYIDNQLTDQPDNDTALITTIKRDSDLGGFLTTQDVTLQYSNIEPEPGTISGFAYLKSLFDSGTCNEAQLKVFDDQYDGTKRIYTGVIKVPSIEILEKENSLTAKLDDNSFYSYIKNNRNVIFDMFANRTKNGLPITPPDVYEVDFFDSATGAMVGSPGNYIKGYRLYDVLQFLIPALSDNKVTFESTFLTSNPFGIELFIFDGLAMSQPNTSPAISISFDRIWNELKKLKNISFYIDQTDPDAPVFRLEDSAFFYVGSDVIQFDDPEQIKTSVKTTAIYGTISVGSDYNPGGATSGTPIYTWIAGTSYYGWKRETYTPLGQCNTDNELNLVNDIIIASNAVNDQVNGATTSNLDEMFLVECWQVDENLLTAAATDYDTYAVAPVRYYNIGLNNLNKISFHGGNFQSALTNTADSGQDIFRASMGQDTTLMDQTPGSGSQSTFSGTYPGTPNTVVPVPFADEFGGGNYDPGGNYLNTPGSFYYTVPSPGNFSFATNLHFEVNNLKSCVTPLNTQLPGQVQIPTQYGVLLTVDIEIYSDNTFSNLLAINNTNQIFTLDGTYDLSASLVYPPSIGNVVRVRSQSQLIVQFPTIFGSSPVAASILNGGLCGYTSSEPKVNVIALEDSTFECNGTPEGGLILAQNNVNAFKIKLHEFQYDIDAATFLDIEALPIGRFPFTFKGVTRYGWIEELQYNNWTGRAKIKLITEDATT